ncbi:7342_t:CDS:2, partial [Scutellospora calospora]
RLWTRMTKSNAKKSDIDILKAQLRQYACNEEPYNGSYVSTIDSLIRWWKTTGDGTKTKPGALSLLAIKLFSVRLYTVSYERVWSCYLELENFIELNNVEQDVDDENIDKNTDKNIDDEEFNIEEFDENQFGAE